MSTSVAKEVLVERPVLGSVPWVVASFQKKRKKQVPGTRPETGPDDQTRQEDQTTAPSTSGHKTSPHKRATTPRATTARTTRNFYSPFQGFDLKGNCCLGSALVPLCCLPPAEFGRPLLSEVANSALLPLFPHCGTRVIPMTKLGGSTVREFLNSFTASKGEDETSPEVRRWRLSCLQV